MITNKKQLKEAYEELDFLRQDPTACFEYSYLLREILDYNTGVYEAWEEGKAEGKAEAKAEGKIEANYKVAKNLLAMGMTDDQIHKATEIPLAEIEKIRQSLK